MKTQNSNLLKLALCCVAFSLASCSALHSADGPSAGNVILRDFKLVGDLSADNADFTLSATAHVDGARGGSLDLLAGPVALTEVGAHPRWHVGVDGNRFAVTFDRGGDFPVQLKFSAAVKQNDGWNEVNFSVAPSTLQPIELRGLAADTQFQFAGAARPDRTGTNFNSYLPADGTVKLAWKEAPKEEEGKLFYSSEMLSQISVGPGLMEQASFVDYKVMQGEVNEVGIRIHGAGEVTRVVGDHVLAWNIEPVTNSEDRRLVVKLNEPQKDLFAVRVEIQTPLGAFPQTADAVQLRPEAATRFSGIFRIVNDGAVRLEVVNASGLSQVAPEQFLAGDDYNWKPTFRATGSQQFVYRFSSPDFALRIQADQILPEISVSQVTAYHLGENELSLDAQIELDIREAPVRELLLRIPKGYSVAKPSAGDSLNDYFVREPTNEPDAELRLVFGQPISGRQVVELHLEHNAGLGTNSWALPKIEVTKAKSVRGYVGVAADAGFRLTAERTEALTEIATAFFPAKVANLQTAFRLSDPDWAATLHVERLPQSVQADVLHLFSIGEGIAYGSSVINYVITGSPVSSFKVGLSDDYYNVEFTGQDVTWQKTAGGYLVSLHTPVSGAYTLLATYERPFKPGGETLEFAGAQPLDAQSEQGYTLVTSAYQFEVKPANVSAGLLELEPGEVPPEYRLFFDAPILAAYRYSARPFSLNLALSPLAQGESLSQVVDRASLTNRISKEGQVLTDVRYYLKNRGNPHFRLTLPEGTHLWSATVNGAAVVPVTDGSASLIPLPQRADPDAVLTVDLKLAARSDNARRLTLAAPIAGAPVMLEEWTMEPDSGQRLEFRNGSLTPAGGVPDISGFAQLARLFREGDGDRLTFLGMALVVMVGIAVLVWRRTAREGVNRSGARLLAGALLGAAAFLVALIPLLSLAGMAGDMAGVLPRELKFLAPVQQANSALTVDVSNVSEKASVFGVIILAWPALLALVLWGIAWLSDKNGRRPVAWLLGWLLFAWTALRFPNGAQAFFYVLAVFLVLHIAVPALKRLWQMPRAAAPSPALPPATETGGATAVVGLLLTGLVWLGAAHATNALAGTPTLAESVSQQIRVEDDYALGTANIRWQAARGDVLPLLVEPAVLTHVNYSTRDLKLAQSWDGNRRVEQLVAQRPGVFDIQVQYQLQLPRDQSGNAFRLPTPNGLVNELQITLAGLDVDVASPQAVSVRRETSGTNTVANVVLSPLAAATVEWKPRTRDVKSEKSEFYAEIYQLYAPSAGVIEAVHFAVIKPAQGELSELTFDVPAGATITDVTEPAAANNANASEPSALVSLWRFDPDTRKLRVNLRTPQSKRFTLAIRSQVATGPLPFEQRVGLLSVENSAGQIGLVGVATGNEVQLDAVNLDTNRMSAINLEDFPGGLEPAMAAQIPGLTVRRAFRYSDPSEWVSLKASAVEPDVRVEAQNTISLGEDRTVLAVNATANITRAGIFKLSFVLPPGMDVDSVSGDALSHWTESKSDEGRVITLHLKDKTLGQQNFAISLAGPGVKATNGWAAPQLIFREAGKQWGTLVVAPEQGMRLQMGGHDGITQLDPQKSGIQQKGVLAFRILQAPWSLALDIEQVDPWIQVTSLQHATINEAQTKVVANLQYQIENAGLKAFHVYVPTNAEGVRFQGDQVGDYLAMAGAVTNGLQEWEIKLHRRVIGPYLLQLSYQVLMPERAAETTLRGVEAADVSENSQRGFVTVQAGGRLELRADNPPAALQPAEWQSIPRALQQGLLEAPANFAYRLVEPSFALPLKLERHEAAKLLPARVQSVTFTSVISDDGVMLTEARLNIIPGDKRLLNITLPAGAHFWFAFVNQNGVWPWREQDRILIPLEQQSRGDQPVPVEFFYTSQAGSAGAHALDLELQGPKFDLPLENISWRVHLNEKWRLTHWSGSLQLQEQTVVPTEVAADAQAYLQTEAGQQRAKSQEAESMLATGNMLLQNGDPAQARRAFQSAYGLSQGDDAFNEDARVQLNNLKLQQALVGLNVRQAEAFGGDAAVLGGSFRDLHNRKEANYTQQDAKDIIDRNTADENAAFMKLAQRLIQQQDAAVNSPAAIRANIPESGRVLTFQRAVVVDEWADLRIGLQAAATSTAPWTTRILVLAVTLFLLALAAWAARPFRTQSAQN